MRSSLLDVIGEEYITTVRAKGIREDRVLWGHAVRNALLPTISQIALGFGFVLGGAITVELVFSYPGLGLLTIQALDSQDFLLAAGAVPLLQRRDPALEPGRRPVVQLVRPAGEGGLMAAHQRPAVVDPRPRPEGRRARAPQARVPAVLGHLPQEQDGDRRAGDPAGVRPDGASSRRCWSRTPASTSRRPPARSWRRPRGRTRSGPTTWAARCSTLVIWGSRISLLVGLAGRARLHGGRRRRSASSPATAAVRGTRR